MSYLLDKKIKRKKFSKIALGVVFLIILFYFRVGIFNGLSYASEKIFHPVFILGNNVGGKLKNLGSYFVSKSYLSDQNQKLQAEVTLNNARIVNYDSLLADNASLKEILGRKDVKTNMVLAAVLAKPNQSIYDSLLIDAGTKQGIKIGNTVFAFGNVPIGKVSMVYDNSSKIILFSNAGEKTQAIVSSAMAGQVGKNIFIELVGRGGGNFEIIMPKDFILQKGDQVLMPGLNSYVLAVVENIISDPRDSFTKALLVSPVNTQELKFVEVEIL